MSAPVRVARREFLAAAWFPFFHKKHISLAGARFRIHRHGHSARRYLVIHGNEDTARQVLLRHIRSHHGIAYVIEGNTRNVPIQGGQIDPNRMFSRAGAERNLKTLNPTWTAQQIEYALNELDRGREKLVRALFPPPGGLTVALHNNETYSVKDELAGSDATSIREPENPHAFFLCTDPGDFKILAQSAYNVVLQYRKPEVDDGSLSRLAAARKVRYVNLEVAHGQFARQSEMLQWLDWVLPERA